MEREKGSTVLFMTRVAIVHFITYFIAGLIASRVFDYKNIFTLPIIRDYMLPYGSPTLTWGPFLQPIRGIVLGLAILPFRDFLGEKRFGWLYLWLIFICFGIFGTPAASPASMEGILYSRLPLWYHIIGLPEILLQTLAFSWLTHFYLRHPKGIVSALPPVFGTIIQSLAGACFAFVGYAIVSICFALAAGVRIEASGDSMSLRTQGMFILPLLINSALIFASGIGKLRPSGNRGFAFLTLTAYASNAAAIVAYQALFLGGPSLLYALVAPILPAMITAYVARPVARTA